MGVEGILVVYGETAMEGMHSHIRDKDGHPVGWLFPEAVCLSWSHHNEHTAGFTLPKVTSFSKLWPKIILMKSF